MAEASDRWYVRLPDGRVIRAKSTRWLRYHLTSGRIPTDARVRRSPAEEWTALEWTAEFVDVVAQSPVTAPAPAANANSLTERPATRAKLQDLKVLGLRGMVEDLTNALESTLHAIKLMPAAGLGIVLGIGVAVMEGLLNNIQPPGLWIAVIGLGSAMLLAFCLVTTLTTQVTFVELSRLRPARTREIRAGLGSHTVQLWLAHILLLGFMLLILLGLEKLPGWLLWSAGWPEGLVAPVVVLRQVWHVAFWPFWILLLLLGPITIIEERSFVGAIREWWGMARRHVGRLLLYETMAVLLGLLMSAPFLVPAVLSAAADTGLLGVVSQATTALLVGLALTPCVAYLLVANVFIYLDLRYEVSQANR